MFAVSSNALLARPAAVTRGARAPAARRVVSVHASADAPVSTKMAKMATVALLSATVAFAHPGYANAGLFGGGEKVGKYAEDDTARYMREIEEARKAEGQAAAPKLSAESMYQNAGGACGPGYELVVRKVLGASCECVDDSCKDGAPEGAREVRSESERSFGKGPDADVQSGGVTITFMNK